MVADHGNKKIAIFTSEGKFFKSVQCSAKPVDVAVDPESNVHVAMEYTNHIAVYAQDGKQIETYNLGDKLHSPVGIYIDCKGNRFIICDSGCVYIADSRGKLIATRRVVSAQGVTVDRNGVIYVTEHSNARISIY